MNPQILTRNTKSEAKNFLDHLQFIGSMDRRLSVWPSGSMPGQKSIRLAKKAVVPLSPMRASGLVAELSLSPRVSLRKGSKMENGKV